MTEIHNSNRPQEGDNQVRAFSHEMFGEIRVINKDGELWFVGSDVAKALGYSDPAKAIRVHCEGVDEMATPSAGGIQTVKIIPESDLYLLVLRSKLDSAKQFQQWVVKEVLPTLRKSGRYEMPAREKTEDEIVLEALQIQQKKIAAQEAKIRELTPKAAFADAVVDSPDLLTFTQVAKWLKMKSAQEITKWLHSQGVIFKQSKTWLPYAKYSQCGYFKIITHTEQIDGENRSFQHAKITQAGKEFILRLWNQQSSINQLPTTN